jgi:glutathione synthase/RimK-type ligase-like ATP-grasp enzyme
MTMPKCAFLSIANTEGWFIDDDLVHEPLKEIGWEIVNVPWDQKVDWNTFDVVVIRSPWDYQDRPDQFIEVLIEIETSSAKLFNTLEIVKWNINKSYLFELEKKGVELVPTLRKNKLEVQDFSALFDTLRTDEIIVKPIVGANADDTFRIKKGRQVDLAEIAGLFHNRECMIQPFMQNIVDEGEFSLMYFDGKLSHSILKTVGEGDFRVQEEHGGGVLSVENEEAELIAAADRAMAALDFTPMYARVDLVRTSENRFALMELEMIEPCLYFRFDPSSPGEFAKCIDHCYKHNSI